MEPTVFNSQDFDQSQFTHSNLIIGNSLSILQRLPSDSIDLTVTSPPYDNLRPYNGYCFDFEPISKELYRITKPGGILVWIVADATKGGSETGSSFKQALYFKEFCGFNIHDTMIYASDKPPLTHNRYEQKFEFMFVFSKGKPKTFNPLMEACKYSGETKEARTFRHTGTNLGQSHQIKSVRDQKIKGNIWTYSTGYNKSTKDREAFTHPAIFPEALAEDHILSWSQPGDLILDPFVGSGTTGKMALLHKRSFIGIDICPLYIDLARRRMTQALQLEAVASRKVA